MRRIGLALLLLFAGLPLAMAVGANGDSATALVPKDSEFLVRLPSLDRMDALGKEILPMLSAFMGPQEAEALRQAPVSQLLLGELGVDPALVDRTQPLFLGRAAGGIVAFAKAADGAVLESETVLANGSVLRLTDGMLHVLAPGAAAGEARGVATAMLGGDVAVHVYLGELVEKYKPMIEGGLAMAQQQAGVIPMPPGMEKFMPMIFDATRGGIYGVASLDYALTWKGEVMESEGLLRTREDSAMRKVLARAGEPGDHALASFLPKDSLLVMDFILNTDWPAKELTEFLTKAMGESAGKAILQMMGPTQAFQDRLTGRAAASVSMMGMMGASTSMLYELKEGVDPATFFDELDVEAMNKAFAEFGLPLAYQFEKAVTKHGETALHRMTMQSSDPAFMALAMMQTYVAAEGGHVIMSQSPSAEQDLRNLLDAVRAGGTPASVHLEAMGRLGRKRNFGMTMNLGALKPMAGLLMMFSPEGAQFFSNLPDEMYMSTAITFDGGDIRWRGDWPVKQIVEVAQALGGAGGEEEEAAPPDEDFD